MVMLEGYAEACILLPSFEYLYLEGLGRDCRSLRLLFAGEMRGRRGGEEQSS
jgi:hypothetical protein